VFDLFSNEIPKKIILLRNHQNKQKRGMEGNKAPIDTKLAPIDDKDTT